MKASERVAVGYLQVALQSLRATKTNGEIKTAEMNIHLAIDILQRVRKQEPRKKHLRSRWTKGETACGMTNGPYWKVEMANGFGKVTCKSCLRGYEYRSRRGKK